MDCRRAHAIFALGLIALLALFTTRPAAGADPDDPTEEEVEEQSLRHEVIEWEPSDVPPLFDPRRWNLQWRDGLALSRAEGDVRIRLNIRYLADFGVFHIQDELRDIAGQSGWDQDVTTRQGRPDVQAVFFDRFFARASYEFEDSEFKDVYFGIRGLGPLGTLQMGYLREPFSLELRTSFLTQTFMERSIAQALSPDRNYGIQFTNTYFDRRLRWAAGAFWVSDEFGGFDDISTGDNAADLTIRVNGLPLWEERGRRLLLVGLSYNHRFNVSDDVNFSVRPESFLVSPLVGTGDIRDARAYDRWGVESAWVDGSLSLQGEFLGLHISRGSGRDIFLYGGYVQASYFPTGERRIYGRRSGSFGRVVPRRPFDPSKGRWGALELTTRVSYLDLDDADVRGGRELNTTLGVNWHLLTHVRLEANYVLAAVLGDGLANIFQARIQLDY